MPLLLPTGWVSIPAPNGLGLTSKWEAVKDARLPADLSAASPSEAHALTDDLVEYRPELDNSDHWQPPAESLELGHGDCEDWSLVARALLLNGGANPADIWLLIVYDLIARNDHALLWLPTHYLNCQARRPLEHSNFADYRPIVAFSATEAVTFGRRR